MQRNWPKEMTDSIVSVFHTQVQKYGDRALLMEKVDGVYQPKSWREVADEVKNLSLGLMSLGVAPKDRVALMMTTQANWAISDLAILSAAAVNVPVYPTNKGEQIAHILNDSEAAVIIAGCEEIFWEVHSAWPKIEKLKAVIVPDNVMDGEKLKELSSSLQFPRQVLYMQEVKKMGKEYGEKHPSLYEERWQSVKQNDLASVLYTSGTTGNPKGVMLSHNNFLSNVRAGLEKVPVYDHYISLSFLPLSHVLERTAGYYLPLVIGSTIAYAEGIDELAANMVEVRPHFMVSVPRVYEKAYQRILDNVYETGGFKKKIFLWSKGVSRSNAELIARGEKPAGLFKIKFKVADALVFKKVREKFGGRLEFCISGGAPLGKELAEFFNGMQIRILEGYGLTETSPIITFNTLDEIRYGSVGRVIPGGEVRIAEDGEILSKGPQNCLGYFNNVTATEELFEDGWLKTGDIGYLDEDKYLFITDRKKDIIVTSGGKNIAPQPLEALLTADRYISQVVIQGDQRNFLVAVLVPNMESLGQYAAEKGLVYKKPEELMAMPEIRDFFAKRVASALSERPRFEQVKRVYLMAREFTLEEKELTPTLKIKRRFIFNKYLDIFNGLYADGGDFIEIQYGIGTVPISSANKSTSA
ncbi:MAG: long-chain fatty acid--CoA ligase [Clostridiales bacterium]|jgi:long-chain acyl-CoA synthetase|nr:long-chain fatty acid--CoA ligase [Clostridiales bacterium]